jgi:hypothetical protein
MSESFYVNMSYFGSVVLKGKKSMTSPNFCILWLSNLWRGPGPLLEQFKIPFTQGWFVPSLTEIGLLVLEKIFFFRYKHKWIWFSLLWLLLTSGDPDLKKLESTLYQNILRKWPILAQWFLRRFYMTPPNFCIFVIISPLKRTWPFIWTI